MTDSELIEALEPFALEAAEWSQSCKDVESVHMLPAADFCNEQLEAKHYKSTVTVGDLRRLAAIYNKLTLMEAA